MRSISGQDSKKSQISLPVSNENIVHLDRRLRSDKADVHYFITSPLPPRDLGVEFAQPTALTVTPNSTFGAVGERCERCSPARMHVCIFWKFGMLNDTITLS